MGRPSRSSNSLTSFAFQPEVIAKPEVTIGTTSQPGSLSKRVPDFGILGKKILKVPKCAPRYLGTHGGQDLAREVGIDPWHLGYG